jgi:hypothetical protein
LYSYFRDTRLRVTFPTAAYEFRSHEGALSFENGFLWEEWRREMGHASAKFRGELGPRYDYYREVGARMNTTDLPSDDEWRKAGVVFREITEFDNTLPLRVPPPKVLPVRWAVPYWVVFVASVLPLTVLVGRDFRKEHRRLNGLCARCGYDVRGSPGRCPECGEETTTPSAAAAT